MGVGTSLSKIIYTDLLCFVCVKQQRQFEYCCFGCIHSKRSVQFVIEQYLYIYSVIENYIKHYASVSDSVWHMTYFSYYKSSFYLLMASLRVRVTCHVTHILIIVAVHTDFTAPKEVV